MITRSVNLACIIADLQQRGAICELDAQGMFQVRVKRGVLSEEEKAGIDLCRSGLTAYMKGTLQDTTARPGQCWWGRRNY